MKTFISEYDLDQWDAWTPGELAERMKGIEVPWCVAAGWALDLFAGYQRREHEDLEMGIPHDTFPEVRAAFADHDIWVPFDEKFWSADHHPHTLADSHQSWVREHDLGKWKLDIFREPSTNGQWVCRRDESIQLDYADIIDYSADNIPYLKPEYVLLFKAKAAREKDEQDWNDVVPRLTADRRRLLHDLIEAAHPGHKWLDRLHDS